MKALSGYTCPLLATLWATVLRLRGRKVRAGNRYAEQLPNGGWAEIRLPFPTWMILAECGLRNWSMRAVARVVFWRQAMTPDSKRSPIAALLSHWQELDKSHVVADMKNCPADWLRARTEELEAAIAAQVEVWNESRRVTIGYEELAYKHCIKDLKGEL